MGCAGARKLALDPSLTNAAGKAVLGLPPAVIGRDRSRSDGPMREGPPSKHRSSRSRNSAVRGSPKGVAYSGGNKEGHEEGWVVRAMSAHAAPLAMRAELEDRT